MGFIKDIIVNVKRFVNKKTLKDANLDPHNVRNYLTEGIVHLYMRVVSLTLNRNSFSLLKKL